MSTDDHAWELLMVRMDRQDAALDNILAEAKITNGRVTKLEVAHRQKDEDKSRSRTRIEWLIGSLCVLASGAVGELLHLLGI